VGAGVKRVAESSTDELRVRYRELAQTRLEAADEMDRIREELKRRDEW
jgi:hypothetical protein